MVKKSITFSLLAFLLIALAAPVISLEDCEMPCCLTGETTCCIQQEKADCPMEMSSCETPLILLLISGPKAHINQMVELEINHLTDLSFVQLPSTVFHAPSFTLNLPPQPPAFLPPLLI